MHRVNHGNSTARDKDLGRDVRVDSVVRVGHPQDGLPLGQLVFVVDDQAVFLFVVDGSSCTITTSIL